MKSKNSEETCVEHVTSLKTEHILNILRKYIVLKFYQVIFSRFKQNYWLLEHTPPPPRYYIFCVHTLIHSTNHMIFIQNFRQKKSYKII